jgi:type IV secretory pathway VirB6-like protein
MLLTAVLVCGVLLSFGSHASAPNAPPSILGKVKDLQELPSVSSLIGNAVSFTTGGWFGSSKFKRLNAAQKEDVYSICTCPSENPNSFGLPKPNGTQNVDSVECGKIYAKQKTPIATIIIGAVIDNVNKMINGISEKFYKGLIAGDQLTIILSAALTLYLVIYGIMVSSGMMSVQPGDTFNRLVKIGILFALLNPNGGWVLFSDYFGTIFKEGMMEMVSVFSQISNTGLSSGSASIGTASGEITNGASLVSFLDRPLNMVFSMKFMAMMTSLPLVGPFGIIVSIIIFVCILLFVFLVVGALLTFLKAIVGIYIMLGLAPIFISMYLFKRTRELFNGWLNQLITFFLQPILVFAFLGFFVTLFTNNLKNIVDKTEYCYVPFMPLFGDMIRFSWFRPAVLFDESAFKVQEKADADKAMVWANKIPNADKVGVDQALLDLYWVGKLEPDFHDEVILLVRYGKLKPATVEALRQMSFFGYEEVDDPTAPNGITNKPLPPPPAVSSSATPAAGQFLYAYKGGWKFEGPTQPGAYATGRVPIVPMTSRSNDFPVNSNDVMIFMLITFLGWRYSQLVSEIAGTLGSGITSSSSGSDAANWFKQKTGARDVYEATMNKASNFRAVSAANLMGWMAGKNNSQAAEAFRPDLVNPDNAAASRKNPNAKDPNAEPNGGGGNPDPSANRGNPTDREFGPRTKEDDKINDDTYFNMVKSRALSTREKLKKEVALNDLGDESKSNEAFFDKLGRSSKLSKEQRELIKSLDNDVISREKLDRMLKVQDAKMNRKVEDYIRNSDKMGADKDMSVDKLHSSMKSAEDALITDELIIQRINKKLQSM